MHNSIKGALAAITGGALLLGGAGSLAYWSDEGAVAGTDIASGTLDLATPVCEGWKLDGGAALGTKKVVPGDVLTQVCTFAVVAAGEHLAADFDVSTPTWGTTNDLTDELAVAATYKVGTTDVDGTDVPIVNNDVITATVKVTFDGAAASNDSQTLTTALDDITITATQSHA